MSIKPDLIEPYWNVKIVKVRRVDSYILDLIEPYWNVKTDVSNDGLVIYKI